MQKQCKSCDATSRADINAGPETGRQGRITVANERSPRELLSAMRPFARENRWRSWWFFSTTLIAILGMLVTAALAPWWPARLAASIIGGLTLVRGFILYHDFMHRAILTGSPVAMLLMHLFGMLLLAPARSWRATHNHHHANVGKLDESDVGSFAILTIEQWRESGFWQRLIYRFERSSVILLLAYPVMFMFSITLRPLLRNPRKHWDSLLSLILHGGLIAGAWSLGGLSVALFAVILPFTIACCLGAYLFYIQHNVPGVRLFATSDWNCHGAAFESCSYLRVGRIMGWFTGDIGLHHIHHLNAAIPFYRLNEAMCSIPECQQHPVTTTLWPTDILRCLQLKLWDLETERLVGFREARATTSAERSCTPG